MTPTASPVVAEMDPRGVARITLNRPEVGNAYDEALIQGLTAALSEMSGRPELRAVLLKGHGRAFPGGGGVRRNGGRGGSRATSGISRPGLSSGGSGW